MEGWQTQDSPRSQKGDQQRCSTGTGMPQPELLPSSALQQMTKQLNFPGPYLFYLHNWNNNFTELQWGIKDNSYVKCLLQCLTHNKIQQMFAIIIILLSPQIHSISLLLLYQDRKLWICNPEKLLCVCKSLILHFDLDFFFS